MSIPLPDLIHQHRINAFKQKNNSLLERQSLSLWRRLALHYRLYQIVTQLSAKAIYIFTKWPILQSIMPFVGKWKTGRALMKAGGNTFQHQYRQNRQNDD